MIHKSLLALILIALSFNIQAEKNMDALNFTKGEWQMKSFFYIDKKWVKTGDIAKASVTTTLKDAFIIMKMPVAFPGSVFQFEIVLSYDRFNNVFRLAALDDLNGYMDIYTGQMKDKILTLDNINTGTAFPNNSGGLTYGKLNLKQTTEGFTIEGFVSQDPKARFANYMKLEFAK